MKQNCSAKKPNFTAPPPGMAYKIQSGNGSVYYLGSCPEGKQEHFVRLKKVLPWKPGNLKVGCL